MNPAGKLASVRTLPSTLMRRCITMALVSRELSAYLSLQENIVRAEDIHEIFQKGIASLPVANEHNKGHAIAKFMGTRRWLGSVCSGELV